MDGGNGGTLCLLCVGWRVNQRRRDYKFDDMGCSRAGTDKISAWSTRPKLKEQSFDTPGRNIHDMARSSLTGYNHDRMHNMTGKVAITANKITTSLSLY